MAAYGLVLDPWQEEVLRCGLGERANGKWAVRQIGCSAPRQQGKTIIIVARILAGLLLFNEQVIIVSAHRQDTARESFFRLVQIIEDNPSLAERVDFIARSEMREFIRMKSGQEVRFKSRKAGSGRGFSCDCLLLDEAQILSGEAWASILPTMSARPNPQVWLFGTPPTPNDDGEVFARIRQAGIDRKESRLAYLEWSAELTDDFDDPETWAKANPAFGTRITHEAIASERATMDDEQFAMERLGIWVDERGSREAAIPPAVWRETSIPAEAADEAWPLAAIGLDMDPVTGRLWVCMAAHADEPNVHVELLPEGVVPSGTEAVVAWVWQRARRRRPVVIPADSPAVVLQAPLLARGCKVYPLSHKEQVQASSGLEVAAREGTVTHLDDPVLEQCVLESERERSRSAPGQWKFKRGGELYAAPLYAAAAAVYGAVKWSKRRSQSDTRGRVVVA